MNSRPTRAYWVVRPGVGELREMTVAEPPTGRSLIRAEFGGISPGTERTVGLGHAAGDAGSAGYAGAGEDPRACRYMDGGFSLPIKYGYCLVGTGIAGALAGQRVFAMHPHQEIVDIRDSDALALPSDLPGPRATLIPNTETALNAVWDADLTAGETAIVVGGGPLGLLVAFVLWRLGLGRPTVVDVDDRRLARIRELPFVAGTATPTSLGAPRHAVAFHATGTGAGLHTALSAVGFEGRVIEMSWFAQTIAIDLGSDFHFSRKRILASQVGTIATPVRATVTPAMRSAQVLELLTDPAVDALLGTPIEFASLPQWMHTLYAGEPLPHPCPLIVYPGSAAPENGSREPPTAS